MTADWDNSTSDDWERTCHLTDLPDALRQYAVTWFAENLESIGPNMMLEAADEVVRLQSQVESLQATIVCAPHSKPCALTAPPENTRYGAVCTCWKADAL